MFENENMSLPIGNTLEGEQKNINIIDIRAPQNAETGKSLSVIKTNEAVPEMLISKIKETVNATKAFQFSC